VISFVDPKIAPQTVNNFVYLSQNHYYDGLTFHRVVAGFVVQGGDPLGNGTGGPAYKLPDENNPSKWPRGTAGMASSAAGVSGSQFFITIGDAPFLETSGVYNHFGQITSGMEVLDAIKQGDSREKLLSLRLFLSEHFLGKVLKNISLGLLQHRQRIDLLLIHLSQSLPLRHLPHQLQRRNPAVRALPILAQLFARQR
jgi:cyclophilin family peptidyl-prolyl cis-trans isomerase